MMRQTGSAVLESSGAIQSQGRWLLAALYAASQALRLYPLENEAVQNALDELQRLAQRLTVEEGTVELRLAGDFLFLNDVRLRLDLSNFVAFSSFASILARNGAGSVEIDGSVTREQWAPFLTILMRGANSEEPPEHERLLERLRASGVASIRVGTQREFGLEPVQEGSKQAAKRCYAQAVQVAREVLTDSRLGKAVNVRRAKRAVQSIVDQVLNNETSIMGMTTLRDYDEYTFTHCVNVCIFSVVLGQKLGLGRDQLYELGLGALFHDLGKMRLPAEVTNKPAGLSPEEWKLMQEHPTHGLLAIFAMHGFTEVPFRAMVIAYEHHMKIDLTGYPTNRRPRRPTLFSRIVAIADGFDAATSRRSYQQMPLEPDAVLTEMRDNPQRGYDQLLVKAFVNATGIFPLGTVVILDTYELAVVIAPNPDRRLIHQPVVRIVADAEGRPHAEPPMADLSETDPATGLPRRTIIKTTDPERYGIRVADYFV